MHLVLAIPVFLALSGAELLWARFKGQRVHRLNDSISNISCGLVDQLVNGVVGAAFIGAFYGVNTLWAPVELDASSPWTWLIAVLGVDLAYYTFHRLSHRVNALWATHVVHHHSEEYNLTISLRQGTVATWVTWFFYLPLALLLPAEVFLVTHALFQVWQFLIHTRLVGKLGPLEWFLVTPSIHRVHHGRGAAHIDKNYGGLLNIWDRMFGTFALEEEEPDYGITTGMQSWNPLWANTHYFVDLWRRSRQMGGWDGVQLWLRPPEWRAPDGPRPAVYDAGPMTGFRPYLASQFLVVAVAGMGFLFAVGTLDAAPRILWATLLVGSVFSLAALAEGRNAILLEVFRLTALGVLVLLMGTLWAMPLVVASLVLLALGVARAAGLRTTPPPGPA